MRRFFKRLILFLGLAAVVAGVAAAILLYPKYREYRAVADGFDLAELDRMPAISEVFDLVGVRYSRLEGEVRYVVPLAQVSPNFINALLAREDSRFHQHHGVDFSGIARAALRNVMAGNVKEGASTITQQLARNTFDLGPDRWRRKGVEALLALRIEKSFAKDQILEAYANRIYFGIGTYGVETGARACFGKSARDLTLSEAAILAGLIRSPNRLSPLKDSGTALTERNQVLARMAELGMVTAAEAAAARAEPMPSGKRQSPRVQENYAMDAVARDHPPRAASAQPTREPGGTPQTESACIQGALVAIDNETGGIRAIVGGRDFKESPYNRALLAKRQVGSTFKPFVYAAAFARGLAPGTLIEDGPLREGDIAGLASAWSPENSDGEDLGLQPAEVGLIRSRNTMTVRVGEAATRPAVRELALKAGFATVPDGPAIYLGAFEGTLKDLTAAYTMFPRDGVRRQPYIIERIEDRAGRTIYKATRAELRCLSPGVNGVVNGLLGEVVRTGTAAAAASLGLDLPAAGKTGTTNDYKDAWFVGYTTRLTCGVWVGMDRPQRIADRGYGSKLALPIWVDFMEQAAAWKYKAEEFPTPPPPPIPVMVAQPVTVPPGAAATPVGAIPVAPAVAVEAATPPPNANYRVIQTGRGLQFQYGE